MEHICKFYKKSKYKFWRWTIKYGKYKAKSIAGQRMI